MIRGFQRTTPSATMFRVDVAGDNDKERQVRRLLERSKQEMTTEEK